KTLAIQKAEAISLWLAGPMRAFFYIFYPAVLLLNGTANKIVMLMGLQSESDNERIHSEEELRMLISESYRGGQINKSEQELLQNVFRFENRVVEEIMVPRPEVVFMDTQKSLDENLAIARNFGHTRFPLCDGSPDCIIGQINIKDLIAHEGELKDLHQIRRDISFVTEVMPLDKLLPEFQKRKQHMAVVLDEYGGTAGIVTMENVLEELVGEIQDEFDNEEPEVIVEDSGNLLVSGRMLIEDAVERFDLAINEEEQEQYNTLAGFVLGKLGKRPREKDIVRQENLCMEVVKMEGMRIDRIRIRKLHERQTTPDTYLGN
ncbi:MAG: hemolysin family protein, partial [Syntrophomonas sp.]